MIAACGEVFVTGNEQAIIATITKKSEDGPAEEFASSLDHAFAVLMARAYLEPKPSSLVQNTITALCHELQLHTPNRIPTAQCQKWASTFFRTNSFECVLRDIEARDPEHLNREQLIRAGLRGLLRGTGWRSACMLAGAQAAQIKRIMVTRKMRKEQGLLGLKLDRWPVIDVVPGTPAAEAGLHSGDVILRVNDNSVSHITTGSEGARLLRGPAGETTALGVKRGVRILTFEARRASTAVTMTRGELMHPGIVYIGIPTFEGLGIAHKVKEIISQNVGDLASVVVLDLRDNPGGRPEEANAVADIFLDDEYLQVLEFRKGKRIAFKSKAGALDVRVVLLMNKNTGSAAEMLILALRDNDRATTVGESTAGVLFGKDFQELGHGQLIVFRSEPTILSPRGNDYSESGVPPDIIVPDTRICGEDEILRRAIQFARTQVR